MTDFKTIEQCKSEMKGNFIGTVISQGDLKSGTKDGRDWTKKNFLIEDATSSIEITAWNEDIQKLKVGGKYEFCGCWWKEYDGKPTLSFGKYAQVKLIGTAPTTQSTMETSGSGTETVQSNSSSTETQTEPHEELPATNENFKEFIRAECLSINQTEREVREFMKEFGLNFNDNKIGMMTKEIYRESKKVKFEKIGDGFSEPTD